MLANMDDVLKTIRTGDCVAIVFPNGARKVAHVELSTPAVIKCWGYSFRPPAYAWADPLTGETLRLAAPTDLERKELWRRVARSRIVSFDWDESDKLTDSQLERILAILDETC